MIRVCLSFLLAAHLLLISQVEAQSALEKFCEKRPDHANCEKFREQGSDESAPDASEVRKPAPPASVPAENKVPAEDPAADKPTTVSDERPRPDPPKPRVVFACNVAASQAILQRLGYYSGGVDGRWGPQSSRAVAQFQEGVSGLAITGQLGQATCERLLQEDRRAAELERLRGEQEQAELARQREQEAKRYAELQEIAKPTGTGTVFEFEHMDVQPPFELHRDPRAHGGLAIRSPADASPDRDKHTKKNPPKSCARFKVTLKDSVGAGILKIRAAVPEGTGNTVWLWLASGFRITAIREWELQQGGEFVVNRYGTPISLFPGENDIAICVRDPGIILDYVQI